MGEEGGAALDVAAGVGAGLVAATGAAALAVDDATGAAGLVAGATGLAVGAAAAAGDLLAEACTAGLGAGAAGLLVATALALPATAGVPEGTGLDTPLPEDAAAAFSPAGAALAAPAATSGVGNDAGTGIEVGDAPGADAATVPLLAGPSPPCFPPLDWHPTSSASNATPVAVGTQGWLAGRMNPSIETPGVWPQAHPTGPSWQGS